MIHRFSSRRKRLDASFINDRLKEAASYDRIAGYFRSSMLEVAGEQLAAVDGVIRVVCNSDIDPRDVATAKAAQQAMRRSWCDGEPEKMGQASEGRFAKLYEMLTSGKVEVRILPDALFGLIHGKAGVIRYRDGGATSFLGSTNESLTAWKLNYELLWEDDSDDAVLWVQQEFDALWNHPQAIPLSDFVVQDIGRIANRREFNVEDWKDDAQGDPASCVIEAPVYRREYGLWAHQKFFISKAYQAHLNGGARFVLADQVGLGKTVQLAVSAMLMALQGEKPVLIIVPKTLILQWQDELRDLLGMPSAIWDGKQWIDEQEISHPGLGAEFIRHCPRRIGIISQGLITSGSEICEHLLRMRFECVIVDEAHRIRRKSKPDEQLVPNNLMAFLLEISPRTKSMLLATATPVQLHPIEAWDLLHVLAIANEQVLGNDWSEWRKPQASLPIVLGDEDLPDALSSAWIWIRNPLPGADEGNSFRWLRSRLHMEPCEHIAPGSGLDDLRRADLTRLRSMADHYGRKHNPFIRHIVRRTRNFLESTIDPKTHEPYLKPVLVRLFGEGDADAIALPPYLNDAYEAAEEFCRLVGQRARGAGFLKTLLLRRMGSSIYAGRRTTEKMLSEWGASDDNADFEEEDDESMSGNLTPEERAALQHCLKALDANQDRDPKYKIVLHQLQEQNWLERGCIVFSQYFDSIWWLAEQLSGEDLPDERIAIYAGGNHSGVMQAGHFVRCARDEVKRQVWTGEVRLVLGTDAASEGLNIQRLGTLINLDLPWNPTRLEQRKGRIQRIGQLQDKILVYNMRYRDSVEDRVHELLSHRLADIFDMFGQIPDVLEDVWIDAMNGEIDDAKRLIDSVHPKHPFDERYNQIANLDWESCSNVLSKEALADELTKGW